MKIEDVELGKQYKSTNGTGEIGTATCAHWNSATGHGQVQLNCDTFYQWFYAKDIEPVDESPKEVPTASYDGKNYIPPHFPLSIADTPASQMTIRQLGILAIGMAAASGHDWGGDYCSSKGFDIGTLVDNLISEMERKKP